MNTEAVPIAQQLQARGSSGAEARTSLSRATHVPVMSSRKNVAVSLNVVVTCSSSSCLVSAACVRGELGFFEARGLPASSLMVPGVGSSTMVESASMPGVAGTSSPTSELRTESPVQPVATRATMSAPAGSSQMTCHSASAREV